MLREFLVYNLIVLVKQLSVSFLVLDPVMDAKLVVCKSTPPTAAFAVAAAVQAWPVVEGLELEVTSRTTKCIGLRRRL
jgi:hypothetical protein